MESFANKLLLVQRQAETLLKRHSGLGNSNGVRQSFLLRAGHFVGVRWEQGDWQVEWIFQGTELVLSCAARGPERIALQFPGNSRAVETSELRAA